jgi:hypothetical protein
VVDRPGSESGATYEGTPAIDTAISDGERPHGIGSSSSSGLCWNRVDAALLLLGLDLTLLLLLRSPGGMENSRMSMSTLTSTGRTRLRIPSAARARDKMFMPKVLVSDALSVSPFPRCCYSTDISAHATTLVRTILVLLTLAHSHIIICCA